MTPVLPAVFVLLYLFNLLFVVCFYSSITECLFVFRDQLESVLLWVELNFCYDSKIGIENCEGYLL